MIGTCALLQDGHLHIGLAGPQQDFSRTSHLAELAEHKPEPARVEQVLELRARVVDAGERRATASCRVLQDGDPCAVAEVVTVRIRTKE